MLGVLPVRGLADSNCLGAVTLHISHHSLKARIMSKRSLSTLWFKIFLPLVVNLSFLMLVEAIVQPCWRWSLQSEQIHPQNLKHSMSTSQHIQEFRKKNDEHGNLFDSLITFMGLILSLFSRSPIYCVNIPMSRWDMRTSLVWSSWAFGPSQPWTRQEHSFVAETVLGDVPWTFSGPLRLWVESTGSGN